MTGGEAYHVDPLITKNSKFQQETEIISRKRLIDRRSNVTYCLSPREPIRKRTRIDLNIDRSIQVSCSKASTNEKMKSVHRGLMHLSQCHDKNDCSSPLCISTRKFMNKVTDHLNTRWEDKNHNAMKCGACRLWSEILKTHMTSCKETNCHVPLCMNNQE